MTLFALFSEVAARRRDRVAVICGDRALRYGELERRAHGVARELRALGLGSEDRVGLRVSRSVDMAAGVLGILAADAAFVPLDPAHPRERRRRWAKAVQLRAVVTDDAEPNEDGAPLVKVDCGEAHAEDRVLAGRPSGPGPAEPSHPWPRVDRGRPSGPGPAKPSHPWPRVDRGRPQGRLAYVIQTSGSTGEPKGVEVEHRSVIDLIGSLSADLGLDQDDRFLHTAPIGFTLAIRQLLLPLCIGATVVIATSSELREPRALLDALERREVSVLDLVPSLWRALNAALRSRPSGRRAGSLRAVLSAGDRLDARVAGEWRSLTGSEARLFNLYGTSETAGSVLIHELDADESGPIPIGRPRSNVLAEVLDESLNPVEDGVAGELRISGPAVARGYLSRSDGARFLEGTGARSFRTGDRARRRSDGVFELLGRLDESEVKIRGVRVHTGEIEAALLSIDGVREAAVIPELGRDAEPGLVAFVAADEHGPAEAVLRASLRRTLIEAMLPARFLRVAELARLPNGKIDRRKLMEAASASLGAEAVPAYSETERTVAAIWRELLGIEAGTGHDFFRCGGSSLLASLLAARLREELGVDVSSALLFERATISAQAAWIDEARREGAPPLPIVPAPRTAHLPLSAAQERMWLTEALHPGTRAHHLHRAVLLDGPLDRARLEAAMDRVAERQEALGTRFVIQRGVVQQEIRPSPDRDHRYEDLLTLAPEQALAAARRRSYELKLEPFDLTNGPIWRTRLLRLELERHALILSMHHLIGDGWSLGLWFEEVSAAYAGRDLEPLPVQLADVVLWQRDRLASGALDEAHAYWRGLLEGVARTELASERPWTPNRGEGEAVELELTVETFEKLQELARAEGVTRFSVLAAAFGVLLGRETGLERILVGTPVAGRDRPELRSLIGLLFNVVPLSIDLRGAPSFRALSGRVREGLRAALANAEVPFDRIVREARPARQGLRNPLFDIMLNHQPPETCERLGELRMTPLGGELPLETAADVMLRVFERANGLRLRLEYRSDRFAHRRMERLLSELVQIVERAVAAPDRAIGELAGEGWRARS